MAARPGNSTIRSPRISDADRASHPVGEAEPWTPQTSIRQTAAALPPPQGTTLTRLAFYGGAITLGALGVVEWPVTLLMMAGTYVADRARPTTASPPDSGALPR